MIGFWTIGGLQTKKISSMPNHPASTDCSPVFGKAYDLNAAMALALSRRSSAALLPEEQLHEALEDFQKILTEDQRAALKEIKSIPDADAVLVFTAKLDSSSQQRKGRSIATRLYSVLQSVRDFSAVIDTFVSSNPETAALIWGSVKLTIQVRYIVNPRPNASR
jgi:hypothetical protein